VLDRVRRSLVRPALLLALPLALAAAAYGRVLDGEWVYDDLITIQRNAAVKDLGPAVPARIVDGFLRGQRPVAELTLALNYAAGRLDPRGYHLVNLLVHLATAVLVWVFTRAVARLAGAPRPEWLALAVAGVFAVHPLQSEAVSYVTQRSEALASGLYLATLLLVLAAERRGLGRRGAPFWAAGLVTFVLALGSKAIAVTLPVAWLLLAATVPSADARTLLLGWRRRVLALLPFAAVDVWFATRTLGATAAHPDVGFSIPGLSPWSYLLTQLRVVMVYLRLLLWPSGQNGDWDFRVSRTLADPAVIVSGLCLVALAAGAVALVARAGRWSGTSAGAARVAGFGVLWFFLVLSVTSSLVPLSDPLVEHRVYLASWGVMAAVAVGLLLLLDEVPRRWLPMAIAAAVAVGWAAPAAALYRRNAVWETAGAFWEDVVAKSPAKARGYMSLSYVAMGQGNLEEAIRLGNVALQLVRPQGPLYVPLLRNLGGIYLLLGRPYDAEVLLRRALEKDDAAVEILTNLAIALAMKRDLDEAERVAARAVALAPSRAEGWNTLGRVKLARGLAQEALPMFERSIQLDPDLATPRGNLGAALAALGRREEACAAWAAVDVGRDPRLRTNLARARAEQGCAALPASRGASPVSP